VQELLIDSKFMSLVFP